MFNPVSRNWNSEAVRRMKTHNMTPLVAAPYVLMQVHLLLEYHRLKLLLIHELTFIHCCYASASRRTTPSTVGGKHTAVVLSGWSESSQSVRSSIRIGAYHSVHSSHSCPTGQSVAGNVSIGAKRGWWRPGKMNSRGSRFSQKILRRRDWS